MLLKCHHKHFVYVESGGRGCPYGEFSDSGNCSLPVYEIYCKECGMKWILGQDELIRFFAKQKKDEI
jgi:hypothetical protein